MTRRAELEQVIEHCIDLLNVIDGDPDVEQDHEGEAEPDGELNGDVEQDDCQRSLVCLAGIDGEDHFFGNPRDPRPEAVKRVA